MKRLTLLALLLLPRIALAAAILPGGGGGIQSLSQIGNLGCSLNDAMVWNGSAWICQGVGAGSGDNTQINGAASSDANFINTGGDGGISWTLNTAPTPDTFSAIVIDGAIAPAKMKSADFGAFTVAAGVATIDNDAVALGTKTTGGYVQAIVCVPPLSCTGADGTVESATMVGFMDFSQDVDLTGRYSFKSGHVNVRIGSGAPAAAGCDNSIEYGEVYVDQNDSRGLYFCIVSGWSQIPAVTGLANVSVDSVSQSSVDFVDGGDINFTYTGGAVTGDVKANSVALTTDTTGNYVQSISSSGAITCTGCTPGEPTTPALSIAAGAIGATEIASTAVTPGTYSLATLTVDADGRITGASNGTPVTSITPGHLTDGGVTDLTEGIGEGGKSQVMDNGDFQYTDGAATPQLKTALHRDGAASFAANSIPSATGTGSEFVASAATATAAGSISAPNGQTIGVASGSSLSSTTVTSPANNSSGGALTLFEDTDLGGNTWAISLAAQNLSGNFSITPAADGKLTASSLLTAATVTPTELSTASRVRQSCISIPAPSTSTDRIIFRAETASTITGLDCITTDGNTPMTVQNGGPNNASSTTIEATITCTTTNTTEAAGIDTAALAAGDWVKVDVVAAVTTTGTATLCVTYTPN